MSIIEGNCFSVILFKEDEKVTSMSRKQNTRKAALNLLSKPKNLQNTGQQGLKSNQIDGMEIIQRISPGQNSRYRSIEADSTAEKSSFKQTSFPRSQNWSQRRCSSPSPSRLVSVPFSPIVSSHLRSQDPSQVAIQTMTSEFRSLGSSHLKPSALFPVSKIQPTKALEKKTEIISISNRPRCISLGSPVTKEREPFNYPRGKKIKICRTQQSPSNSLRSNEISKKNQLQSQSTTLTQSLVEEFRKNLDNVDKSKRYDGYGESKTSLTTRISAESEHPSLQIYMGSPHHQYAYCDATTPSLQNINLDSEEKSQCSTYININLAQRKDKSSLQGVNIAVKTYSNITFDSQTSEKGIKYKYTGCFPLEQLPEAEELDDEESFQENLVKQSTTESVYHHSFQAVITTFCKSFRFSLLGIIQNKIAKILAKDVNFLFCVSLLPQNPEGKNLSSIVHPNIETFYFLSQLPKKIFLLGEYLDDTLTNLLLTLNKTSSLPLYQQWKNLFKDVLSALEYLHRNHFVYNDFGSDHVLIVNQVHKLRTITSTITHSTKSMLSHHTSPFSPQKDSYSAGLLFFEAVFGQAYNHKKHSTKPDLEKHVSILKIKEKDKYVISKVLSGLLSPEETRITCSAALRIIQTSR